MYDLVIGATQLEGKYRLQVFALQQHRIAKALGQAGHGIERGFNRHVIDARLEDLF